MGARIDDGEDERAANRRAGDLVREGRLDEADALAVAVLDRHPGSADAFAVRGYVAAKRGAFARAVGFVEAAVAGRAEPLWLALLADLHRNLYELDAAERWAHDAIAAAPARGRPNALSALGRVLTERGDLAGAAAANLAILAIEPENPYAHFALAEALLGQAEWGPGWREYEWRRRLPGAGADLPDLGLPYWNGMRLPGQRLLVICDQGFGDTIQFSRFLPVAGARVGELVLACAATIGTLLHRIPGVARVLSDWGDLPLEPGQYAAYVQISSLPMLLDPLGEAITGTPTLVADPGRAAVWESHLAGIRPGACRIGLVWAGKPAHPNDRRRSLALAHLLPVVRTAPKALFVALQKGRTDADMELLAANGVLDVADALSSFDDSAALVGALDLLITIDSAPAHLAGALGTATWMLTPAPGDWRWGVEGTRSRWYDSIRLFRQPEPGNWAAVLDGLCAALGTWRVRECPPAPSIRVS